MPDPEITGPHRGGVEEPPGSRIVGIRYSKELWPIGLVVGQC